MSDVKHTSTVASDELGLKDKTEKADFRFCKHKRLSKKFRCLRCKVEVVLFQFWSHGERARRYGRPSSANPVTNNPHGFFSWQCGWEDAA